MNRKTQKLLFDSMPGFAGSLAKDIFKNQIYFQPLFAVQSAICILAALNSHNRRTYSGLRTNLYTVGVSGTATGKNFGFVYARELFNRMNLELMLSNTPGSHLAISTALEQGACASLMLWDEIGKALQVIFDNSSKVNPTLKEIGSVLLQVFCCADQYYQPPLVSNSKYGRGNFIFQQPVFSILGMGTPGTIFSAVNSANVEDGLLPRFLYFRGNDDPKKNNNHDEFEIDPAIIESSIKIAGRCWLNREIEHTTEGTLTTVGEKDRPDTFRFSDDAKTFLIGIENEIDKLKDSVRGIGGLLYSRTIEHILKLSLTIAENRIITADELTWSYMLVTELTKDFINDVQSFIADNIFEKDINQMMRFFNSGEKEFYSYTDLVRSFPMPEDRLKTRLQYLIAAEKIAFNQATKTYSSLETGEAYKFKKKFLLQPFRN